VTPYEQDGITLHCGDCREVLATLPDGLVDAVFEQQRTLF
jgi:DNA modification methylase